MPWDVDRTAVEGWLRTLSARDRERMSGPIAALENHGPSLGTPSVKRITSSRHHNMKELRSSGGNLRILFAFDANRKAILLVGGDKTNQWESWYERNIPLADRLFSDHQRRTGGRAPWQTRAVGTRSAASGR